MNHVISPYCPSEAVILDSDEKKRNLAWIFLGFKIWIVPSERNHPAD
jgi:hypothetical protein